MNKARFTRTVFSALLALGIALPAAAQTDTTARSNTNVPPPTNLPVMVFTTHFIKGPLMAYQGNAAAAPRIAATPNPATGSNVKIYYSQVSQPSDLQVYDAAGKLCHSARVGASQESEGVYSLDVNSFAPGVYIVKLTSGLYTAAQKVLIR
ncbi:MAG: T9SS type A sorting domain-containing protein [Bacteroidia bacterium]|nr:T9SS type A sorting domain-containing protein [Bacteroidia bacterium]